MNRKNSFQITTALEVGISDFHKFSFTVLKARFHKAKPKIITYHDNKTTNNIIFHDELKKGINTNTITSYNEFESIFLEILDKQAPCKTKYVRANVSMFMNKNLRNEIMTRTILKNK